MLRKAVLVLAFAALVLPAASSTARTREEVMPGITYVREQRIAFGAPVVYHVAIGPRPGGLYALRPVLSNNLVTGRETVSSMQRRLRRHANLIGVNADLFNWKDGHPSGIFMAGGILASPPLALRSSLGIALDGSLQIARIRFAGTFQVAEQASQPLRTFNRPLTSRRGFALFVPSWGARTPATPRTNEAILTGVGRTLANRDRAAQVVRIVRGAGHLIPPGGAILQAHGTSRAALAAEVKAGAALTYRLGLDPWWAGVRSAIGGGPLLVRDGVAVPQAGESFTPYQLFPRHPRTAVGQLADGRVILVAVDGRSRASAGLSISQLAQEMVRLGAVNAMALDAGGSTTMAFNGSVLNRPSDGSERLVGDSLQLVYLGAYARKPRYATFSPNGDGAADVQRLFAKFVRPSNVHLRLIGPDGLVKWQYRAARSPGTITRDLDRRSLQEGTWRWIVSGVDNRGLSSRMERRFQVNKTLGFLTLSKNVMKVRRRVGGRLRIGFQLAHEADVTVTVRRPSGRLVRRLVSQSGLAPGGYAVIWNGKNHAGLVVRGGTFVVVVRARNTLGGVALHKSVAVRRVR